MLASAIEWALMSLGTPRGRARGREDIVLRAAIVPVSMRAWVVGTERVTRENDRWLTLA